MRRSGVTLVELLVGLSLTAVIVLGARQLLAALGDAAGELSAALRGGEHAAAAAHRLRALAGNVDLERVSDSAFVGDETHAAFTTWYLVDGGWLERGRVTLVVERAAIAPLRWLLVARHSDAVRDTLLAAPAPIELRYLETAAHGGRYTRRWIAPGRAPLALAIVSVRDTIVLRIGARG